MTELIHLKKGGSSIVRSTSLIQNTSSTPIHFVRIIYPNRFRLTIFYKFLNKIRNKLKKRQKLKRFWNKFRQSLHLTRLSLSRWINFFSRFSDRSRHIGSKDYILKFFKAKLHEDKLPLPSEEWKKLWGFDLPDPKDPHKTISFSGFIDKTHRDVLSCESFNDYDMSSLLDKTHYTIFDYRFDHPIEPNDARWISIRFRAQKPSKYSIHAKPIFLSKVFSSLFYRYNIWGPYDVRQDFTDQLFIQNNKYELIEKDKVTEFLENNGLKEGEPDISRTTFQRVAINIEPCGLDINISDNDMYGIQGVCKNPDIVPYSKRQYLEVYRYASINNNISTHNDDDPNHPSKFQMSFRAKPINLPHYIAALFMSLTVLIINILIPTILYALNKYTPNILTHSIFQYLMGYYHIGTK